MSPIARARETQAMALELEAIGKQVQGLGILHGDPERFHLNKDEASRRIARLARALRGEALTPDLTAWRSPAADRDRAARRLAREAFNEAKRRR